jgi:hypothetical protein
MEVEQEETCPGVDVSTADPDSLNETQLRVILHDRAVIIPIYASVDDLRGLLYGTDRQSLASMPPTLLFRLDSIIDLSLNQLID